MEEVISVDNKTMKDAGIETREEADLLRELRTVAGATKDVNRVDEITELGEEVTAALNGGE